MTSANTAPLRVLIVDPDPGRRALLVQSLQANHCVVLERTEVSLNLLDHLPLLRPDVIEFLAEELSHERLRAVVIRFVTDREIRERLRLLPATPSGTGPSRQRAPLQSISACTSRSYMLTTVATRPATSCLISPGARDHLTTWCSRPRRFSPPRSWKR